MKLNLHHILIVFCLVFLTPAVTLYGQDAGAPNFEPYEPDTDRERERVMYSPGEIEGNIPRPSPSVVKDSASTRFPTQRNIKSPSEAPKNASKPKEEDDSILSFNFLYYIIQKYKLQDIVD